MFPRTMFQLSPDQCSKYFPVLTPAYSQLAFTFPKLTNRDTRKRCEIRLKLAIKTSERRYRRRSGVFIVNSEYISHLDLVFLLLTLNMYLFTLLICTHPNITRIKSNFFTSVCITVKDVHEFSVAKHLE